MIKELLKYHKRSEKNSRALIQMFNNHFSKKCEYYNKKPEAIDEILFMNQHCRHPKGDGHCCIASCPMGE